MYVDICKYKRGDKKYTRSLLRESYREKGKVKQRTIGNISHLPMNEILAIKAALKGEVVPSKDVPDIKNMPLKQGPSVGALFTLIKLAKRLGITGVLGVSRIAVLVLWLIFARIIDQGSRLSAVRLAKKHAVSELMGLSTFDEDNLYAALDWVADNQEIIEKRLFEKRFADHPPNLFLYDVTSSYLEGCKNELASRGYNRDKKQGKMQIVIGLLTDQKGIPVAVRVFEGNTSDPTTCLDQVKILAESFGVRDVTLVGDRGMIKSAQIEALNAKEFHFITAITKPQIESLIKRDIIQLNLFDKQITEVTEGGTRYILRRNPLRADEIEANRQSKLESLQARVERSNSYLEKHKRARVEIQVRNLRAYADRLKLSAWIDFQVEGRTISIERDNDNLEVISRLDGCYVIKTDLKKKQCDAQTVHDRYKDLSQVELAFRTLKTGLLEVRPVYVRKAKRTRGHVFITMLAYMITHELRRLTPERANEPLHELIDQLAAVSLVELEDKDGLFYRLPKPNAETQKLLTQLDISIPSLIPLKGFQII
jgi:transposase